mgnify:CR=1 FL=1
MADADGAGGPAVDRQDAEAWLEPRLRDAPPRLAEAVRECLDRVEPGEAPEALSEWLARAALEQFGRVEAGRTGDREEALRLLAADASLTFAFQAAAEEGEELARVADEWGASGRLGRELAERVRGKA